MFGIGVPELIVILIVALLVFGPQRLPELGRTLGRTLAELRRASEDLKRDIASEMEEIEKQTREVTDLPRSLLDAGVKTDRPTDNRQNITPPAPPSSGSGVEDENGS
jgi:sec-independent protein translocase protein TatA